MLLDPDPVPHSQYGSGSRTAKSMRIVDPQHWWISVLRIRDVYPEFFPSRTPDPHQRIEEFSPKNLFLSSGKYDPGCSSLIRILIFYFSRIQRSKGTGSRIHKTLLITVLTSWCRGRRRTLGPARCRSSQPPRLPPSDLWTDRRMINPSISQKIFNTFSHHYGTTSYLQKNNRNK
jgi:hypothetical protein